MAMQGCRTRVGHGARAAPTPVIGMMGIYYAHIINSPPPDFQTFQHPCNGASVIKADFLDLRLTAGLHSTYLVASTFLRIYLVLLLNHCSLA